MSNNLLSIESNLYDPEFTKDWVKYKLYDLADWLNGMAFKDFDFSPTGLPIIKIAEIKNGFSGQTRYTQKNYENDFLIKEDDILFAWSGQPETSIDVYLWQEKAGWLNQHIFKVTPKGVCDRAFFFYLLRYLKPNFIAIARNKQTIGLGHVTVKDLKRIKVGLPPLPEQRAIADVLSALDDKIELNRRINRTLEQLAQALFKHMFLDNPEREKWGLVNLGDYLDELVSGSRPKGGAHTSGIPSIGAENVNGLGYYDYTKEKYVPEDYFVELKKKGANIRDFDILLYKDGAQIGRKTIFGNGFPHQSCVINEHVFILRSKNRDYQEFLYFSLDQTDTTQEIINLNSNSAQPGINKTSLSSLKILNPPEKLINQFHDLVNPLLIKIFLNCKESRTIAELRDALLPKLMSGQVRVAPSVTTALDANTDERLIEVNNEA